MIMKLMISNRITIDNINKIVQAKIDLHKIIVILMKDLKNMFHEHHHI